MDSPSPEVTTPSQAPPLKEEGPEAEMMRLQERLKEMETQNQLINGEYARLLREKEVNWGCNFFKAEHMLPC